MDDGKFKDTSSWRADEELKEKLIHDIVESGQNFGVVMSTIQAVDAYFLSKAETALMDEPIKTVSESARTICQKYAHPITDRHVHKHSEDP